MNTMTSKRDNPLLRKLRNNALIAALVLFPVSMVAQSAIDLGTAGNFTILTKTGLTNVATSTVVGHVGVSPIASTAITGMSLALDASGEFATTDEVSGKVYAANYNAPTPAMLTIAVADMLTAYNNAAGAAVDFTESYANNLSGLTIPPGVYKWAGGITITTDVTLDGDENAVWIFQVGTSISQAASARVLLTGGARSQHIFWQTGTTIDIAASAHIEGILLSGTGVTLAAGATVTGRILAKTNLTMDQNTIRMPAALTTLTGNAGWRLLSSPIQDATYADLFTAKVFTQGFPGATNPSTNFAVNVIHFNESTAVFQAPANLTSVMGAADGFGVFAYADNDPTTPEIDGGFPKELSLTGLEHEDMIKNLSFNDRSTPATDGWNLIGNPFIGNLYPSHFQLENNANLNNSVYTYDPASASYIDIDATDVTSTVNIFRGFWVKTDAAGQSIAINQSAKIQEMAKRVEPASFVVTMTVDGRMSTLTLRFDESGSLNFTNADAYKLSPLDPVHAYLFTQKTSRSIARGSYPLNLGTQALRVPLFVTSTIAGTASLQATNNNMPEGWKIDLIEKATGTRTDLETGQVSFTLGPVAGKTTAPGTRIPARPHVAESTDVGTSNLYDVEVSSPTTVGLSSETAPLVKTAELHQNFPNPFNPSTVIRFEIPATAQVRLIVFDQLGRTVATLINGYETAGLHEVTFNASALSSGLYFYQLQTGGRVLTQKLTLTK